MKTITSIILSTALIFSIVSISPSSTDAAAQKFGNCKELNKVYSGGVAKDATVKNKGGKTKYKPTISAEIYQQNIGKDRDKDGIACER